MKTFAKALTLVLIMLYSLTGCGVCKHVPVVENDKTDSVRVEIREHYIHDSVEVKVPEYIERVITRDTTSHLENGIVVSDATVSNGFLSHSLRIKPQTIKVPVDVAVTDTTTYHGHTEVTTQTVTEYVEKELNWWQKFRLNAFWWLVAAGLIGWRREIIALVKKIIKLF